MNSLQKTSLHSAILQAWECAFSGTRVIYLSGPITTGPRHLERLKLPKGAISKTAVTEENCLSLKEAAMQLRRERSEVVVEPASLNIINWMQTDYLKLWADLLERHVKLIIFMPGWEYSVGCVTEFYRAKMLGIHTEAFSGAQLTVNAALALFRTATDNLESDHGQNDELETLSGTLNKAFSLVRALESPRAKVTKEFLRKDQSLDVLAEQVNVAQFVSFSPKSGYPNQEYCRLLGETRNVRFSTVKAAVEKLFFSSSEGSLNVRSYEPNNPQSREFIYGLTSIDEVIDGINRLTQQGLHTIVNETIDVHDGGVSGVLMGDVLEFSPDDTPRCVEKPGTASLPRGWGLELLSAVYGFPIGFDVPFHSRLEFSIHPRPVGWRHSNTLAWELSEALHSTVSPPIRWPNRFSQMIGDKTFGLLVAHHIGLPVPMTTVVNRRIAPFTFGRPTTSGVNWIRTAPAEQVPGKFTTNHGWLDPFELLKNEDPTGDAIMSVLSQHGVVQVFSGAMIVGSEDQLIIEGKRGEGESFMLGNSPPEHLPMEIKSSVGAMFLRAKASLGAVRFEWVHDGEKLWIMQLHTGATNSNHEFLTNIPAKRWETFDVRTGLEKLRQQIQALPPDTGIILNGRVGVTSHFADVIRRANIAARMSN